MASVIQQPLQGQGVAAISNGGGKPEVKRRSCDECRARKLACTKEPDGCARCKREHVVCNYSAQKPMGRPRKSRSPPQLSHQPSPSPPLPSEAAVSSSMGPSMCIAQDWPGHTQVDVAGDGVTDLDLGLDMNQNDQATNPSLIDPSLHAGDILSDELPDFLDFLGPDFISTQPLDPMQISETPTEEGLSEAHPWQFNINFDPPRPPTPPSSSSPSTPPKLTNTPSPMPAGPPCSCLANLYLSLDALSRLSDILPDAIRTARAAAKTAYDAMHCEICCPPLSHQLQSHEAPVIATATISGHQTTMLLGTLIPTIANAYHRILALVDAETARASAAQTTIPFSLSEIGGFWMAAAHGMGRSDGKQMSPTCPLGAGAYENMVLDPPTWRLSVRAVLKVDVYGVQCSRQSSDSAAAITISQVGLRDLVARMDETSKARHAEVDALIEAGGMMDQGVDLGGFIKVKHTKSLEAEGRSHLCRNIITMAKEAVDSLVIP